MALYIVSTPIGNLGDITTRALETLKEVSLIAAEDTRTARKLCTAFGIKTPLVSHHGHSSERERDNLIAKLKDGQDIALISEAGTPGISDPGEKLIKFALLDNIDVIPIPGACAFLAALTASGLPMKSSLFLGFIPHKKGRKTFLETVRSSTHTIVFYESCHRIEKLLREASEIDFEERNWCIGREITKLHETWYRGTIQEISSMNILPKGEFSIVVEGRHEGK